MEQLLIIEDDIGLNQGLSKALKADDRQIISCQDLKAAKEQLLCGGVSLILLDINLPDGSEMCIRDSPRGNAVTAVTSADQGENVCAFSHGQPVCMKLFCVNFLLQSVSTDTFSKACGHRNSPNERMCAVSITSVLRSFAAYIHTSNGIYSTCRHSSGMSSGTYEMCIRDRDICASCRCP